MKAKPPNPADLSGVLRHQRLEFVPAARLRPHPSNPRTHSKAQIRQIASSIGEFEWTDPIIKDEQDRIISGHGRVEAAKLLGIKDVPAITLRGLSEDQIRLFMLAANRIGENAGWDDRALELVFKELELADVDLSLSGFSMPEIDQALGDSSPTGDEKANALPTIDAKLPVVTQRGDTWILGRHRLHCGDATKRESYVHLLGQSAAQLVVTDPPFNVAIDGHVGGLGAVRHREFAMASGEMSEAEFVGFLEAVMRHLKAFSADGALQYMFIDWAHIFELLSAGRAVYDALKNICVWNKSNGGMGSLYRSKHELVAVFKAGRGPHINNIELGRHGRYRTNVWDYAGINTFGAARAEELAMHPTVKPVELIADVILDASRRGDAVLDAFAGSGTIVIAAERVGRSAFAMEIDPQYADTIVRRFQHFTGDHAIHELSGMSFDALARARSNSSAGTEDRDERRRPRASKRQRRAARGHR